MLISFMRLVLDINIQREILFLAHREKKNLKIEEVEQLFAYALKYREEFVAGDLLLPASSDDYPFSALLNNPRITIDDFECCLINHPGFAAVFAYLAPRIFVHGPIKP